MGKNMLTSRKANERQRLGGVITNSMAADLSRQFWIEG